MATEDLNTKKKLIDRLKVPYRLVIMNQETFQEVNSFNLSLLSVYVGLSSLIVGVAILVSSLIIFTPLKRYIPGFGDLHEYKEVMRLTQKVEDLENEVEASKTYTESFRKMLTANVETEKDIPKETVKFTDSAMDIKRIPEDERLRQTLEVVNAVSESDPSLSAMVNVSPKDVPLSQFYFTTPVNGEVSKGFDIKSHPAIDIIAPKNTAIKAIMDGYVIASDWTLDFGNMIAIQHANNIISFYKHNSSLLKKTGTFVKAGEAIAIIGNTGELSTGPHLHFELWYKGKSVDPANYIKF